MDVLQGIDLQLLALQGRDRFECGAGPGQGGDRGYGVVEGGPAQVLVVVGGLAADRCVDDQLNTRGADRVFDVGPALMHLEDRFHREPGGP